MNLPKLASLCLVASIFSAPALALETERPRPPEEQAAPIAYLYDVTSGQVLFAREADRRFMPASLTKVMTTFLAFEWMDERRISQGQTFSIRPALWREWSGVGSTMFLPHDARISIDQLVHGVTTVSANDGAAVLAESAAGSVAEWVAAMNAKAEEIGMKDSRFGTPNGWMDEGRTFTTARDLALLATQMVRGHPSKYRHFVGQREFTFNGITQPNHDPITGQVPGADGIKTGFTNQAGYGFLGSAQRDGRRLVVVVAGSERARERNGAARDLIEWGFSDFDQEELFAPNAQVASASVQGGSRLSVGLQAPHGIYLTRPTGQQGDVELTVSYDGPLKAPIRKGEALATLTIKADGVPTYSVPLVAVEEIEEAGFLRRFVNGFAGWFR